MTVVVGRGERVWWLKGFDGVLVSTVWQVLRLRSSQSARATSLRMTGVGVVWGFVRTSNGKSKSKSQYSGPFAPLRMTNVGVVRAFVRASNGNGNGNSNGNSNSKSNSDSDG